MKPLSIWAGYFKGVIMLEKILESKYEKCKNEEELEEKYNEIREASAICLERRAEEIGLDPDAVGY